MYLEMDGLFDLLILYSIYYILYFMYKLFHLLLLYFTGCMYKFNLLILYCAGFSDEANDAADRAENARQKAENASSRIEDIIGKLPKDRTTVLELETVIRSTNIEVNTALNQGMSTTLSQM